jgi:hypothetical protein
MSRMNPDELRCGIVGLGLAIGQPTATGKTPDRNRSARPERYRKIADQLKNLKEETGATGPELHV